MPVNGKSKQLHEQPAIVKSNLQLILVFVKHPPGEVVQGQGVIKSSRSD